MFGNTLLTSYSVSWFATNQSSIHLSIDFQQFADGDRNQFDFHHFPTISYSISIRIAKINIFARYWASTNRIFQNSKTFLRRELNDENRGRQDWLFLFHFFISIISNFNSIRYLKVMSYCHISCDNSIKWKIIGCPEIQTNLQHFYWDFGSNRLIIESWFSIKRLLGSSNWFNPATCVCCLRLSCCSICWQLISIVAPDCITLQLD